MLEYLILSGTQACATGTCPQAVIAAAPVVAAYAVAAPLLPGKTTVQYRRNLFGRLVPVQATNEFVVESATVQSKGAKGSSCKGNCK